MPQKKKKTNKKSHEKPHTKHINPTIVQQAIPNYASDQVSGHQFNKDHPPFVPILQQQQLRTDNLISDLLSRVITKIENDGTQQTQQYSQAVQPLNNDNGNSGNTSGNTQTVNVYPTVGQSSTTSTTESTQKSTAETAGAAIAQASGLSAAEAGGIGAGVTAGIGGLIAARNKIGTGIMGAISGIKKGISRAPKAGGAATESRLLREHDEVIRGTKPGTYAQIPSAPPSPKIPPANFDKVLAQAKKSEDARTSLTPINEIAAGTGMRTPQRTSFEAGTAAAQTRARLSGEKSRTSLDRVLTPQASAPKGSPKAAVTAPPWLRPGSSIQISSPPQPQQLDNRFSVWSMPDTPRAARTSGIQQADRVSTREVRRQTGEPHVQLEMGTQTEKRPRGRPRTQPETQFSSRSATEPGGARPRGRPRSTMLSQAETPTPNRAVTRNITKIRS
jgi:hypothetical protein